MRIKKRLNIFLMGVVLAGTMLIPGSSEGQSERTASYSFDDDYPLSLKAEKVAVLNAPVDGVVGQIHARAQDFVKKDEVLVQLDDELIALQIARIETQIKHDVSEAEAGINLAYSKETYDIVEELYNTIIDGFRNNSPKDLMEAKQRWEVAQLGEEKAKLAMLMLKNELKINQHTLRKHSIRAPMDGVVVPFKSINSLEERLLKPVEEGELVRAGQEVVALMKVDRLRVSPILEVHELPTIRLGQQAYVFVRGDSGGPYIGQVVYISPIVEVKAFTVEVEFKNPLVKGQLEAGGYRYRFRDGMKARVSFDLDEK